MVAVGTSRAHKAKKPAPRRTKKVEAPARYSYDYPAADDSHSYLVKNVPIEIWRAASARADGDDRSLRYVLIRFLELYAAGQELPDRPVASDPAA